MSRLYLKFVVRSSFLDLEDHWLGVGWYIRVMIGEVVNNTIVVGCLWVIVRFERNLKGEYLRWFYLLMKPGIDARLSWWVLYWKREGFLSWLLFDWNFWNIVWWIEIVISNKMLIGGELIYVFGVERVEFYLQLLVYFDLFGLHLIGFGYVLISCWSLHCHFGVWLWLVC